MAVRRDPLAAVPVVSERNAKLRASPSRLVSAFVMARAATALPAIHRLAGAFDRDPVRGQKKPDEAPGGPLIPWDFDRFAYRKPATAT